MRGDGIIGFKREGNLNVRARNCVLILLAAVSGASCLDKDVPAGPSLVEVPGRVAVTVEYRQPNGCDNSVTNCDDRVVFFGSWMAVGNEILLNRVSGTLVWTGRAEGVPVNFPPADDAYRVRIYDPHLRDTATQGVTANRLKVGSQLLTKLVNLGTTSESGLVFIDAAGAGHNPF